MKPIYVKMSAFGSYAGVETVDFTDVNHGIFLITGDTGAGKTTIFDAISYALFDQTSGGKRDGEMMRSQYAEEETRTFVEYKFIYNDEIYIITRSPRQKRISKKRNKDGEYTMTVDQPGVELIMPDGMPFKGKIKETNQKIVEIIGLDVNQFTQISMIAQGDFLKLLHAPSKERKEIFSKIFNTRIYWRIEEELKKRAKEMYIMLEDNRKDIEREMDNIQCIEESIYESQWAEMPRFSESEPDKQMMLINQIIEEAIQQEAIISKAIGENQKELTEIITKLQQAQEVNKLFSALEIAQTKKEELDGRKEEIKILQDKIESAKKALLIQTKEKVYLNKQEELTECNHRIISIKEWLNGHKDELEVRKQLCVSAEEQYRKRSPEIASKISKINELLPQYQQLEEKLAQLQALTNKKTVAKENLDRILEEIRTSTQLQNKLANDQQELKVTADGVILLTQTVDHLKRKKEDLENLLSCVKTLHSLRTTYLKVESEFKEAEEIAHLKSEQYDSIYQKFIEGQAGILAHELKDGCPCPVCGSTSHPQLAIFTDTGVTQNDLQIAKRVKEEAEGVQRKKNDYLQQAKQNYENNKTLAEHEGKKNLGTDFNAETVCEEDLKKLLDECLMQLNTESEKKNQALIAKQKYDKNELQLKEQKKILESYATRKDTAEQTLKDIEINLASLDSDVKNLKSTLIYESIKSAKEELSASQEQARILETAMTDAAKNHQKLLDERNIKQGTLKTEETGFVRLSKELQNLKQDFENEIIEQGFANVDVYHSSLLTSKEIDGFEKSYQEYREEVIKNDSSLKHYTEQTNGKSKVQTLAMNEKKAELELKKSQLEQVSKAVYGIRSRNEMAIHNVTKMLQSRQIAKEEYAVVNRLDSTANGRICQKHMNFQTYIQRRYFNSILKEANKRLYIMSNGQFILKCKDVEELSGQGEVGLDLDVYSMVNDQTRDVKTLSGGESFMAALAMALGLADIIQNTAGRIHIDTMFIDEGFGSLSDETRMQAINILNDLSEGKRLVGIISHVSELKAQIDTKLMVTKSEKGSKVKWELGARTIN